MHSREDKANPETRRDVRSLQLSELSIIYKGVPVGVEFVAMPYEAVHAIDKEIGVVAKNW